MRRWRRVELADVAAPEFLHQSRYAARFRWTQQQVDVVVHQHVRVQYAACFQQRLSEQVQVAAAVGVIQEAGQAVVATLDDVLGMPGRSSRGCLAMLRALSRWPLTDSAYVGIGLWESAALACKKVNLTPFALAGRRQDKVRRLTRSSDRLCSRCRARLGRGVWRAIQYEEARRPARRSRQLVLEQLRAPYVAGL